MGTYVDAKLTPLNVSSQSEVERAFSDNETVSEPARPPLSRRVSTHPAAKRLLRRYASISKVTPLNPTAKFSESDIVWPLLKNQHCAVKLRFRPMR